MVVKLLIVAGSASQKEVTLRRPRTVVGRKKGCKLRIRSHLVSRIHCSLIQEGEKLLIKDLGSSNGTFVNGIRISEASLNAGDVIQVGGIKFVVQIIGGPAGAEPKRPAEPTVKMANEEVLFCEVDEQAEGDADADEVIEADLLEELEDDDAHLATHGAGQGPVPPAENIFAPDPVVDAEQFVIPDDDEEESGGDYGIADPPDNKNPRSRR